MKRKWNLAVILLIFLLVFGVLTPPTAVSAETDHTRLAGGNRFETAYAIEDYLAGFWGTFDSVCVASGLNYPDALSSCYFAYVTKAPMLLVSPAVEDAVLAKIRATARPGGYVYLIGGEGSVSKAFEDKVAAAGFHVIRIAGPNRFDTNLTLLRNLDNSGREMLVASGMNFPDSLPASAVSKPLLLVGGALTADQKDYLQAIEPTRFYILGGPGSVSPDVEAALKEFGVPVERLGGADRFETSYLIAKRFFNSEDMDTLTMASGFNFPDGLAGGPAAMINAAPLLLVGPNSYGFARDYAQEQGTKHFLTFGGEGSVAEDTVKRVTGEIKENEQDDDSLAKLREELAARGSEVGFATAALEQGRGADEMLADSLLAEYYPFVREIQADRYVHVDGQEIMVVVPRDPQATVKIEGYRFGEDHQSLIGTCGDGKPFVVLTTAQYKYAPVHITITNSDESEIEFMLYPSLDDLPSSGAPAYNFSVDYFGQPRDPELLIERIEASAPDLEAEIEAGMQTDGITGIVEINGTRYREVFYGTYQEELGQITRERTFAIDDKITALFEYDPVSDSWQKLAIQ